jgi:hypothetical protein
MIGDFYTKPLQGSKFTRFCARILGITAAPDMNVVPPVCKECVEDNDSGSPVTSMDDISGLTTSWTEVVRKSKKVVFPSNLVGKRSDPRLTLFTKQS